VLLSAGSPLEYVPYAREKIAAGAKKAGRNPGDIRVGAYLVVCVDEDGARAKELARPLAAHYMGLHGIKPIMTVAGLTPEEITPFRESFLSDTAPTAPVTDKMLDALVVAGDPDYCRAKIQAYIDAGVDMPVIFEATGVIPPEECLDRLQRYLIDV
jgi:5,10-methylenetetrahydromethanopterin reductase